MTETERDPLAALMTELRALHERAGAPSTRAVADRAERARLPVSHSAVHSTLSGGSVPSWETLQRVIRVLGADPEEFRQLWLDARPPSMRVSPVPAADADLTGGTGREYRMTSDLIWNRERDQKYCVAELTEEAGLVPRLDGLERWQALAIVAILHPPFE